MILFYLHLNMQRNILDMSDVAIIPYIKLTHGFDTNDIIETELLTNVLMRIHNTPCCFFCLVDKTPQWRKSLATIVIQGVKFEIWCCNACRLREHKRSHICTRCGLVMIRTLNKIYCRFCNITK